MIISDFKLTFSIACLVFCMMPTIANTADIQYYPPELNQQLQAAFTSKGKNYKPRTF